MSIALFLLLFCQVELTIGGTSIPVVVNADGSINATGTITIPVTFSLKKPANPVPPPTTSLNVKSYGAVGNGTTDDQAAIVNAVSQAKAQAKPLYFPAGKYRHSGTITLSGVSVFGDGDASQLYASDPMNGCIWIKGDKTSLKKVSVDMNVGTLTRVAKYEASGVMGIDPTNALVENVKVMNSLCVGIYFDGGTNTIIRGCSVENTKADGIHFSRGCIDALIEGNYVNNTGDDNIASMSYVHQTVQNRNITIRNNTCRASWRARGITAQGVNGCLIEGNTVWKSGCAGIYCCAETGVWDSWPNKNVTIRNNTIDMACYDAAGNCPTGHPAIMVWSQGPLSTHGVFDTLIEGNTIKSPNRDGVRIMENTNRTTARNNIFSGVKVGYKNYSVLSGALNVTVQ